MTDSLNGVIDGAEIRRERMLQNLASGLGLHAASRLLTALVDTGMQRDAAYSIVQVAATSAREAQKRLRNVARSTPGISNALNSDTLDVLFGESAAIRNAGVLIDRLDQID